MKSTRMLVRYLAEIGSVGGDILRLYRRLVDWNLKKLFVLAYFAGGALMLSVPFVILLVVVGYAYPDLVARLATAAAGIGVGRPWSEMADAIAEAAVPAAGIALAVLGIVTAFLVSSVYSVTLLARVYLGYARGVVTPVKSLPLFSWPLLRRVLAALTWQGLWLLAGLLAVAAVLAGARWVLGVNSPFFYGIIAVAGVAVLVYAVLRMSFVFGALAEEADGSGWSLAKSNWQLFSG